MRLQLRHGWVACNNCVYICVCVCMYLCVPWQAVPNQFTLRSGKLRRSLATVAAAQWATLTASCPWPPSAASCLVPPAWQPPPAACCLAALFAVSANKLAKCQLRLLFSRKREIQNRRKTKPKRVAPRRVAEQPNKHKKKWKKRTMLLII